MKEGIYVTKLEQNFLIFKYHNPLDVELIYSSVMFSTFIKPQFDTHLTDEAWTIVSPYIPANY